MHSPNITEVFESTFSCSENGLICFQRDFEPRTVPGCNGDAFQVGNGDDDFCIQASANTLNFRGDNGQPASAFPLGNCQGDCDSDEECAGNLRCFERAEFEDVPGCQGFGVSGFDYCANFVREGDVDEGLPAIGVPVGAPVGPPVIAPVGAPDEETPEEELEAAEDAAAAEEDKANESVHRFFQFGGRK